MARQTWLKVSGVWKKVVAWVKVSGTWQSDAMPYIKVSGDWKQCGEAPYVTIDKGSVFFSWDQISCSGTLVTVISNTNWSCVMRDGTHFELASASGTGDGSFYILSLGDNFDSFDYVDYVDVYKGVTLETSITCTQYSYGNSCN